MTPKPQGGCPRPSVWVLLPGLNDWYRSRGRHLLPWRLTRDPYAVLVSEVMLQQTQVGRVLPAYDAWLARWPSVVALAAARRDEVIRAWAGLGYNRRAVNLHRAAETVEQRYDGRVPVEPATLLQLPGVGPYTAAAVASFAAERRVAVIDTNIGRVLARAAGGVAVRSELPAVRLTHLAAALLPEHGPACRHHNLALMDLGATTCTARAPACGACPLADGCAWRRGGAPPPRPQARRTPPFETTARFARGRIVAALREGPRSTAALAQLLPPVHAARLDAYLRGLTRDGLIVNAGGALRLAASQGSNSIASPNE